MSADKPRPGLADYVTIVISPALIMAMIVSLVFFLLAIFYRGEYAGRLHTILFFFIFGIVLVARIAMEAGNADRAPLYGAVLALLVWVGMGNFVSYPPEMAAPSWLINAGLIALAWWLSYRLVLSCTYIDEKAENTGTGVLQAAGLDNTPPTLPVAAAKAKLGEAADDEGPPGNNAKRDKKRAVRSSGWDRYQRFREAEQKKQPPGLWIVYFGLAALPIFGLGQALIEVADVERRANTFFLMTVYIASALGLLVTTSFLGLRRYLRQRRLEMPMIVTAAWLVLGTALVAALTMIGAALPRPQAEFSPFDLARVGSTEQAASKYALSRGDPGKGAGQPGAQKQDPEGKPAKGKNPDGEGKGDKGKATGQGDGATKAAKEPASKSAKETEKNKDAQTKQDARENSESIPEAPKLSAISSVLKWLVFGILALATLFFVMRGGLKYLANFSDWARRLLDSLRRFWEGLFIWRLGKAAADGGDSEPSAAPRAPFRAFANPFQGGRAEGMKPVDLVRYSFEALEAWAGERACGRQTEETPMEFTNRLADEEGSLDKETQQLGSLYARVLYADGALPPTWRGTLEGFWQRLGSSGR